MRTMSEHNYDPLGEEIPERRVARRTTLLVTTILLLGCSALAISLAAASLLSTAWFNGNLLGPADEEVQWKFQPRASGDQYIMGIGKADITG